MARKRDIKAILNEFVHEEYWWSAELAFRWWGGAILPTYIEIDDPTGTPTAHQIRTLELLLTYRKSFRREVERKLSEEYQNQ